MSVEGKVLMFTGTLSIPRWKAQQLVEKAGGVAGSSVSRNTDYLVVGSSPGSKQLKAEKLGVKAITEEEFFTLLKGEPTLTLGEEITNEQWEKLAQLGITVMTTNQLGRLLKHYEPSYRNPELLDRLLKKYRLNLLPPTTCKFCGETIPYSIHTKESYSVPEGTYYCFNCKNYSDQKEHNCIWEVAFTKGTVPYLMCKLCGDFLPSDSAHYKDLKSLYTAKDYHNSMEYLIYEYEQERELGALRNSFSTHICNWVVLDIETENGLYRKCKVCGNIEFVGIPSVYIEQNKDSVVSADLACRIPAGVDNRHVNGTNPSGDIAENVHPHYKAIPQTQGLYATG